jgi:hypothetical protein
MWSCERMVIGEWSWGNGKGANLRLFCLLLSFSTRNQCFPCVNTFLPGARDHTCCFKKAVHTLSLLGTTSLLTYESRFNIHKDMAMI